MFPAPSCSGTPPVTPTSRTAPEMASHILRRDTVHSTRKATSQLPGPWPAPATTRTAAKAHLLPDAVRTPAPTPEGPQRRLQSPPSRTLHSKEVKLVAGNIPL